MLHGIEGIGALPRRIDRDGAAALGRRALGWLGLAGAMALLCRVQPAQMLAPFAMAFMAAALLAGHGAAALLAGCLAGAVNGPLRDFNLRLPIGAAIVLGGSIAWDLLRSAPGRAPAAGRASAAERGSAAGRASAVGRTPIAERGPAAGRRSAAGDAAAGRVAAPGRASRVAARLAGPRAASRPAPGAMARSPNGRTATVCSALAGAGVSIPGLAGAGEALWPAAATVAAASVAAVAAAPFMRAALELRPGRRWRAPEERTGACMLLCLLAAGLARLSLPAGLCAACALAQLLYPGGALAGAALGGALTAVAGDARLLALACAAGAVAQLCAGLSRPARAACACGAALCAGLLLNAEPWALAGAGLSSLLAAPLPEAWAEEFARLARPAPAACDPQRLALRLRRESAGRLRALAEAFGELAEGYLTPVALPDERALVRRLRERLCAGCAGYALCWDGEQGRGARLLCELIAKAAAMPDGAALPEEATPELARRCRRARLIPERLREPLEDFARARRGGLKRGAENRLISAQFLQARELLEGLADRQARPLRLRPRQAERAAAALERAGIPVESAMAAGEGEVQIVAALDRGRWTPELARLASRRLGRAFGRAYAPAEALGREMRFAPRPRLRARSGVACAPRKAGAPCGDSHLACMLDDERLLVLICDGMGSGEEAARESAVAVRLLGRFLRAGAACPLAIETVNALMLNRSGEDMFATVDMLVLNLATGVAEFTKLAACPTLIARGGEARRVEGGRLPLGILERVRPARSRARLQPGDVLLMASDGVLEAAGAQAIEALLLEAGDDMPALARRVLDAAERARDPAHRDDMTAVCLKIAN